MAVTPKKFNLGSSTISASSTKKLSVSLPKDIMEILGLYAGTDVEVAGYADPVEIIIKPKSPLVDHPDTMIDASLEKKPWRLRGTPKG